jgi:hypothetical protein
MSVCTRCGTTNGVELEDSRTAYSQPDLDIFDRLMLDGEPPPDPNAPVLLCRPCAKEHHEYWDEMWDEYNRGRV